MSMNPNSFLPLLNRVVTSQSSGGTGAGSAGVGVIRSHPVNLQNLRTAAGLTLTAGTNPLIAALETNAVGLQWAAGDSTKAQLNFQIPRDYDENADILTIALLVNSAGNTNSPTITANVYNKRAATAISADLAPSASTAIPKSATAATAAAERTIVVSGKGLIAGDSLTILLAPGTHATDAVNVYGIELRYKSTIVACNPSNR